MTCGYLDVQAPRKLAPLLDAARHKGAHGGRGSGKSHFFAQKAVLKCFGTASRGVCIREIQNSIKDSVKQLIEDKISALGLDWYFEVTRDEIRGKDGSLILFRGMQSFNAENIKSLEGMDWAWVEEAQTLSKRSLKMLIPTIRKPGSELWYSWNPRHDTDAVDEFLRGANKPPGSIVVECNWSDNPWFPEVLRTEMERDYAADPETAENVWGGGYEIVSEGAYYARWIAQAEREGRVGHFPYDPRQRLRTSWDLGIEDHTAVWFIQDDGHIPTVVDFYEANGVGFDEIVSRCMPELFIPPSDNADFINWNRAETLTDIGRDQEFRYNCHFLPHDVRVREMGSSGRHRFQLLQQLGLTNIRKGVAGSPDERVAAGRKILPLIRFNATPRVMHGMKRLRRYKRKFNELLGIYEGVLKDGNDHAADAFGEYAINCDLMPRDVPKPPPPKDHHVLEVKDGVLTSNMSVMEIINMKKRKREANG